MAPKAAKKTTDKKDEKKVDKKVETKKDDGKKDQKTDEKKGGDDKKAGAKKDDKKTKTAKKVTAKKQATKTAKSVKKGEISKRKVKVRTSVHFHIPKTLKLARNPKYERKSRPNRNKMDKYNIIKYPLCTESAMKQIEDNNTLTFIVDIRSNKRNIALAIKNLYEITVVKVNTLIRPDGLKKAYARLSSDHEALEVANRIGII